MIHADTHIPSRDWPECLVCSNALRAALVNMADMHLGPKNAEHLIEVIQHEAEKYVAHWAAS